MFVIMVPVTPQGPSRKTETFNLEQLYKSPELKVNWKLSPYSV